MREDWIECELGDLLKLKNGFAFKASNYKKEGIPVFRIGDINDWIVSAKNAVKIEEKEIYDEYTVETGDILIAMSGATTGKFGIYHSTEKAYQNQRVGNLKLYSENSINKSFVFYLLYSLKRDIEREAYGGAQPNISGIKIEALKTKLAPLPIQRAIVSKIEALFSDLDNGITNLKKAQEQLKIYRQAVLKKAFEGELTKEWREKIVQTPNLGVSTPLPTAEELLKQSSDNLPKEWKWVKSGELFSFVTSGSRGWAKYYSESGSIFIRITNLNFDTLNLDLREEKIQYVNPPQNAEGLRTKVEEGDFLFSITGYLGMFAIAPKLASAFVNQHVCLCRPKGSFNKKYLAYWIIAKSGGHYYLNKNQKGAVKAGLNLDDLKTFPVPLPPTIAEQTQIVQEIESRLSVCDKVEQSISESLEKAEALRQSILKKAFEGKLLSNAEIEQCKKAADYEPAAKLLERIKQEKINKDNNKKTKSK